MAERLTIISSMATRRILAELAATYETKTGIKVDVTSVGGVDAAKRIAAGDAFDVAVLAADALSKLANDGHVIDNTRMFAQSPAAVAVPAGAARPTDVNAAALRAFITLARRVAVSTGPSGKAVRQLLERWYNGFVPHIVEAPPGVPVARLLASGNADIGFQQYSELRGEPGIDILGLVPQSLLPATVFSAGICKHTTAAMRARTLLDDLTSLDALAVKRRHDMTLDS